MVTKSELQARVNEQAALICQINDNGNSSEENMNNRGIGIWIVASNVFSLAAIGFASFVLWHFDKEMDARIELDKRLYEQSRELAAISEGYQTGVSELKGLIETVSSNIDNLPSVITGELYKPDNAIGFRLTQIENSLGDLRDSIVTTVSSEDGLLGQRIEEIKEAQSELRLLSQPLWGLDLEVSELNSTLASVNEQFSQLSINTSDIAQLVARFEQLSSNVESVTKANTFDAFVNEVDVKFARIFDFQEQWMQERGRQ